MDTASDELIAPPLWTAVPFVALLMAIAILPLLKSTAHWWEQNRNKLKVSLSLGAMTVACCVFADGVSSAVHVLEHAIVDEYIPFMTLLFSLYVICGGIALRGDLEARPEVNTAFLAVGTVIASFVGTTGASMLLIRPLLKTNSERKYVVHTVVFFIFLVSNVGGTLLPIGDPPLFMGFLKGVPFLWTAGLWKEWATTSASLLIIYYFWDLWAYRRESMGAVTWDETATRSLTVEGKWNFVWLTGVVAAAALVQPGQTIPGTGLTAFDHLREIIMLALAGLSLWSTPSELRKANQFNYHAILEVAALFLGIFICMQTPVALLRASGSDLPLSTPSHFFWLTGALSSFLDNAPTYVVFFTVAESLTLEPGPGVLTLMGGEYIREDLLTAISLGAVFMGAMTYIGNGPNFMVKSIAEQSGVRMPSFFGFMIYSVSVLLPVLMLMAWYFL